MNKLKLSTLALMFCSSICFAQSSIAENVSEQLQEFNSAEDINELAEGGLVLPNQPLALSDEQRAAIRSLVQAQVNAYAKSGMNMKSYERDTLNSLLFNYGLQVLDNNQVVILDVYVPDQVYDRPMLTPEISMPEGSQVITADNLKELKEEAKEIARKEKEEQTDHSSNSLKNSVNSTLGTQSQVNIDYGSELQ